MRFYCKKYLEEAKGKFLPFTPKFRWTGAFVKGRPRGGALSGLGRDGLGLGLGKVREGCAGSLAGSVGLPKRALTDKSFDQSLIRKKIIIKKMCWILIIK